MGNGQLFDRKTAVEQPKLAVSDNGNGRFCGLVRILVLEKLCLPPHYECRDSRRAAEHET